MNKFLAMLRDSYKEAVDGWIFLVMLIISGVVIVLVGSLAVTPLPPDEAIPRMLRGQGMQMVSADRGQASRMAVFLYQASITEAREISPRTNPWESEIKFTLEYSSAGFGPSGVEVDNAKQPKDVKQIDTGLFSDAFKEAVRYWAGKPGERDRPKYTSELGKEFVKWQVEEVTRLTVTRVELAPAEGGLGKAMTHRFVVTTQGGDRLGWTHRPALFFGLWELSFFDSPLGSLIHLLEDTLVNGIGAWVVLLAGVIVTAGFIPNMLRKGAIDLLLTKPMSRPLILLFKYLGGLLFVFLLTAFTVGGVWIAIGVKTGVWAPGLLYCIGGITFYFAILYACSTLVGVLTRNAIVSIVVTIVFWFLVWLIGTIHNGLTVVNNLDVQRERGTPAATSKAEEPKDKGEKKKDEQPKAEESEPATERTARIPEAVIKTFKILNAMTPRTKDLDSLTTRLIGQDLLSPADQRQAGFKLMEISWGEVLGVAAAYILLFLGLATLRFVTRSY